MSDALALRGARPRWTPPPGLWVDLVAVGLLLALMAAEYAAGPRIDDGVRFGPVGLSPLFSAITVCCVGVRRIAPVRALLVATAAIVVPALVTSVWIMFWTGFMVLVLLLYTVARHRPWRVAVACCALPAAAVLAQFWDIRAVPHPDQDLLADLVFLATFELFVVAFGVALRRSALQEARLEQALAALAVEHADRERAAVLGVRRELARDLHDVVAHAVSLMLIQAGAARLAIGDDPWAAHASLRAVAHAGGDAAADLAAMVAVLRTEAPEPAPAGGLASVPALVDDLRAAGLQVELRLAGDPPALPPGLERAAFRIVQEALTNVLKHAGPTTVLAEVRYADPIRITVVDDGPAGRRSAPPPSGLGLMGMRERAALFGGTASAGPRADGGWSVEVTLPLPEAT